MILVIFFQISGQKKKFGWRRFRPNTDLNGILVSWFLNSLTWIFLPIINKSPFLIFLNFFTVNICVSIVCFLSLWNQSILKLNKDVTLKKGLFLLKLYFKRIYFILKGNKFSTD